MKKIIKGNTTLLNELLRITKYTEIYLRNILHKIKLRNIYKMINPLKKTVCTYISLTYSYNYNNKIKNILQKYNIILTNKSNNTQADTSINNKTKTKTEKWKKVFAELFTKFLCNFYQILNI